MNEAAETTSADLYGVVRPAKGNHTGKWWAAHGLGSHTVELGHFETRDDAADAAAGGGRRVLICRPDETGWDALVRADREAIGARWGVPVDWVRRAGHLLEIVASGHDLTDVARVWQDQRDQRPSAWLLTSRPDRLDRLERAGLVERWTGDQRLYLGEQPSGRDGVRVQLSGRGMLLVRSLVTWPRADVHWDGTAHAALTDQPARVLVVCAMALGYGSTDPERHAGVCSHCDGTLWVHRDLEVGELVGVAEAARIAGLAEVSIRTYVRRGSMPAPLEVAGSDALVWPRATIEAWAAARPGPGRPPEA